MIRQELPFYRAASDLRNDSDEERSGERAQT